jgi:hypothetical protein
VQYRPTMKLEILVNSLMNEFVRTIAVNEGVRAVSSSTGPIVPSVTVGGTAAGGRKRVLPQIRSVLHCRIKNRKRSHSRTEG